MWLAFLQFLLVAVSVEVAAGVGSVNLVNEVDFAVTLAKLILRVHQDEALPLGYFLSALEYLAGIILYDFVIFAAHDALCDDFLLGDVQVMALVSFGGRRDDRLWETLVLPHAFWQLHAAKLAAAVLVGPPGTARKDGAYDHLHFKALAFQSYGHHGVWSGQLPVGADVRGGVQELGGYLVEHLSLEGDALGQHYVEGRDAVCGYHHYQVVIDVVHVAHLSMVNAFLSVEVKIGLG